MSYEDIQELPLANIVRVEIETEEETPKKYRLTDVASEAEVTAYISEGNEEELRVKNKIKAQNKTEDIVKGYDIRLVSATMIPEILALIDGGSLRYETVGEEPNTTEELRGYDAPVVGSSVERKPFTMKIYTEEKDADGSTVSYACFIYKHCKGSPVSYSMQDGQFFAPELTSKSRPKLGESPASIDFLNTLPA